ncbi:group I truncated hemoglobin [Williamsia serinedens]|uniref:Hemoglobin n=1 Tax=Williamsia serinedens TaxID=391736 RepID=A0ABT1GZT1_9NOCA|nr:group 1 truncated hemoglobin [Williamsia serinedens]MCP2160506.1 hemoglobin [Williamsia serinedens]
MTQTAPEPDLHEAAEAAPDDASLFERLGGVYGIAGAVDILVDRLFDNVAVNANPAVHAHHGDRANAAGYKFLVTAWSIEAAGGPRCYPGRDMVAAHDHLAIDRAGFDAVYTEIDATLNFLGVPDRERSEFMRVIESYRPEVVTA